MMNRRIMILAVLMMSCLGANAQKWMTRTGKISFFSSTPVENIEAINNEVASVVDAKSGELVFIVPVKSFKFDKALMQEHFNENYMESDKFAKAEYKGEIINISAVNFSRNGTYNVNTSGNLTMHGVTKAVNATGTVVVQEGIATIKSKIAVVPADYKIKVPAMAAAKIADKIEITVDCMLKQTK